MTYREWTLSIKKEWNGIVVEYFDPEGNRYSEPFCFPTFEEAKRYAQICIDRIIQSKSKSTPRFVFDR